MEEIYKDWKIEYKEGSMIEEFEATKDGIIIHAESLSKIKKRIDTRKKQEFKRMPCYANKYGDISNAEITSIAMERSDGTIAEVWLSIKEDNGEHKYREKKSLSYTELYFQNEKNKEIIKKIRELKVEIKKLESQVKKHTTQFDKITAYDIKNSIK